MKKPLPTEQELIGLLQAKEKKGFDLLYHLYSNALYTIAFKIVHSQQLAEDVLQDSFIKIWKNIHTYDASKGSLFTFILNITRNTAIDKTRSLYYQKQRQGLKCTILLFDRVDQKHCFYQQVDYIGITKYIDALAPQYKHLIEYVYLKGYTHQEAAKALEIPLGTAKSRLKSAIAQLQLMIL
ncbi:RNA polymerase sigma factor [Rhodocytophaga aerolata]|uniref:RNA polymerase sigma factor n=1 Tax=Rhodocytophaga aerolata TaxID=455078 RepID=A0ABT8RG84_9BACT|nr:RNA polymerase sigma factor [Rhodocytophaga aerolata]MDO1451116.1 RNA polymerase sigma factor [Rhodocytophaga aerolata]